MKTFFNTVFHRLHQLARHRFFRRGVLLVFLLQAIFLVFATNIGTPPDENNNIEFIRYYADHSLSPIFEQQQPTWSLGDKTREVDYLYHYVMSLVARLLPGDSIDLYAIRLLTVVTALLSFLCLVRLLTRLAIPAAAINVALAILTNLPMVLMLSAAINNDAAVWLGTTIGALLIVRIWEKPKLLDVLLLLNLVAFGGLIKRTLLPVVVMLAIVGLGLVVKHRQVLRKQCRKLTPTIVLAGIFFVVGSGLFLERVGGNVVKYKAIIPSCQAVQGVDACRGTWQAKRQAWIDSGAPTETNEWLPIGATQDTVAMPLGEFAFRWIDASVRNIIDIQTQGWQHTVTPPVWLVAFLSGLLFVPLIPGLVYELRHIGRSRVAKQRLFVAILAFIVIAAQLLVNRGDYLSGRIFGLALNGRYILPAIILLAGLSAFYVYKFLGQRAATVLATAAIIGTVAASGIIMMVRNPQLFTG